MEESMELSYFLGDKFSRSWSQTDGWEQRKSGSCQGESWFFTVEEKDGCSHLALRSDVNTVPGRGCRKWRILMLIPEERREKLDNEVAREKRRKEMIFSPFQSFVLLFSFPCPDNIYLTFKHGTSSHLLFLSFALFSSSLECWYYNEKHRFT